VVHFDGIRWYTLMVLGKITARTEEFTSSNSMIEGGFQLFKHDHLQGKIVYNDIACDREIETFVSNIGNRYFGELKGETPNTILAGATINHHKFKDQKQLAKTVRIAENKAFAGCANAGAGQVMQVC
jgi:hypothetical protein